MHRDRSQILAFALEYSRAKNEELENTPYYIDLDLENRVISFISILKHTGGDLAGEEFQLLDFQIIFLIDVICTKKRSNHKRRYTTALLFIPRKNGKTELIAAVLNFFLFGDAEKGKERRSFNITKEGFGTLAKTATVYNDRGQTIPTYHFTKKQAIAVGARLNTAMLMKVINRLEELEKQAKSNFQIPQTYSEALMLAAKQAEQIEQQNALIELQKPKVDFYEAVTGSKDTIDIGTVAKVLNIKGFGRNNLFEFLRDKGVLMSNNQPKQTYCDRGYFRVIESKFTKPDGSTHINTKTVVYQKGLDYIRKLLEVENEHPTK